MSQTEDKHMIIRRIAAVLAVSMAGAAVSIAAPVAVNETDFAREAVESVYQPAFERFSQVSGQLLSAAQRACKSPSVESPGELQIRFEATVAAFSAVELFRTGPMLEDNRQNRLFYWPDKRRVGERQMRELLADAGASTLTAEAISGKSVTLQGLPALERLLYGKSTSQHLTQTSEAPDCQVVTAIADNLYSMAMAMEQGWQQDSALVQSMVQPASGSEHFRTDDEVLRSLVTQIVVAIDVVLERKIDALTNENAHLQQAPLWQSGQTLTMIRSNLESIRALSVDTGLASAGELDNELGFEFRNADQLLQKLQRLPALINDKGRLTDDAKSLLRALTAVVGGIKVTLNDRFTTALGMTAGFNSEDGD